MLVNVALFAVPQTALTGAIGVTLFEAADAGLTPLALVAVTVKVYEVPLARPETV
jgi:hypothetical protein